MKSVAARIVFAPKDYADARDISDELGMTTVQVPSRSRPQFWSFNRHRSRDTTTTLSYQQRALLLPQEVKEIGIERALIFYENLRPVRCEKIRYYADRRFQTRLVPAPQAAIPPGRRRQRDTRAAAKVMPATSGGQIVNSTPVSPNGPTVESALAELDRLDELRLEDFGQRLLNLEFKHQGDRPTAAEIDADVQAFLSALR